jgi:hypothetical protein
MSRIPPDLGCQVFQLARFAATQGEVGQIVSFEIEIHIGLLTCLLLG